MSAKIVAFRGKLSNPGNGAREAVIAYLTEQFPTIEERAIEISADYMLARLWEMGFKIVPLEQGPTA